MRRELDVQRFQQVLDCVYIEFPDVEDIETNQGLNGFCKYLNELASIRLFQDPLGVHLDLPYFHKEMTNRKRGTRQSFGLIRQDALQILLVEVLGKEVLVQAGTKTSFPQGFMVILSLMNANRSGSQMILLYALAAWSTATASTGPSPR